MEIYEAIEAFNDFFDMYPELIKIDTKTTIVNFASLSECNLELSQQLLENPDDTIRCGEIALADKHGMLCEQAPVRIVHIFRNVHEVRINELFPVHISTNIQRVLYLL